jgi:uncharacterized protein with HEPN domain
MRRDPRKYLEDIRMASQRVLDFTDGVSRDIYLGNEMMQAAVERQFEIIGEAMNQLSRHAPKIAGRIPEAGRVIGFRNVLIHGYAEVDANLVWDVVEDSLPALMKTTKELISELS